MTEHIGFVGLGIMGQGMAHNLLKAGFPLTVWNRTTSKTEALAEACAQVAETPAQVAAQSNIIVICVSDTPDVESVLFEKDGLFEAIQPGSLVIDCSTISPVATQKFARKLAEKQTAMLDAPISGGNEGAVNGTLAIMVGGATADVERAMPVLKAMGKTITHVGDCGAGQTVKLVNQILVVNNMLGVAEALLFAQAGGVDLEKALQAVEAGAAGSWMLSNRGPQVLERDWRPGFTIDLQQKDLRLVLEAADKFGTPIPSTSLIFQLYRTLQKQGLGAEGNHALVKALEHVAGFAINE
ncbi:NAD(P)-dependent oxidoreductase [Anaerolineales bacterium HSG24]|nr:NAD(P)-dependent oxidoreductase [Anaerolineales bacterium HSG24]